MNTYLVQLGSLGNFGMGDVYEISADNEMEAFNWAAEADGGRQAIAREDQGGYSPDDLLYTDFTDYAYLSSDVSVTLVPENGDGFPGVLRRGKNSGDGPEWETPASK